MPFSYTAQKVRETGNTSLIWEDHKAGRDIGYCRLKKLHNREVLPASWARSVATIDGGGAAAPALVQRTLS